jgi:hypothetical protein
MGNHIYIGIETPKSTLVAGVKWFLGTYTQRYNSRHRVRGHLFSGRYKSLLMDGSDDFYLRTVCNHVHLNPIRAGLVEKGNALESYDWSSYGEYLRTARKKRKPWLRVGRLLGELECRDNGRGRRRRCIPPRRRLRKDSEKKLP